MKSFSKPLAAIVMAGLIIAPFSTFAQSRGRVYDHDDGNQSRTRQSGRQDSRSQDRNRTSDRAQRSRSNDNWQRNHNDDNNWQRNRNDNDWQRNRNDNNRYNDDWQRRERERQEQIRREEERRERERYEAQRRRDAELERLHRNDRNYHSQYDRNDSYYYGNGGSYRNDRYYNNGYSYRSDDRNEWRNLALAAGLIGVIGLLDHDDRLVFTGAAGALYAISQYDRDRYSDDRECRLRARYFEQPYFYRDGRRYDRVIVTRGSQRYYQFVCR